MSSSAAAASGDSKPSASGANQQPKSNPDLRYYSLDKTKLEEFQTKKPWMNDAKYFQHVALSPSALVKMMQHCASGVQKGIAKGGNPIEVMGLLLGRVDYTPGARSLIVTDAFPLPIEGFETRVIADDSAVVNHMISLNECLEATRNEKFMGWYHSHPFDLGDHSHCFLSQTDLSTQLQWQRAEDPHGNPFVALVLDPLRSAHLQTPQLKAFRAFPPEYSNTTHCPDGSTEPSEQRRLEKWGSCWNRYYELQVDYYMSSASRSVLESLTSNYLWITHWKRSTAADTGEEGNLDAVVSHLGKGAHFKEGSEVSMYDTGGSTRGSSGTTPPTTSVKSRAWKPAVHQLERMATTELSKLTMTQVQQQVFGDASGVATATTTTTSSVGDAA